MEFSGPLVPEGYTLVQKGVGVVAVRLVESQLDLVVVFSLFEFRNLAAKQRRSYLPCDGLGGKSEATGLVAIDVHQKLGFAELQIRIEPLDPPDPGGVDQVAHPVGLFDKRFEIGPTDLDTDGLARGRAILLLVDGDRDAGETGHSGPNFVENALVETSPRSLYSTKLTVIRALLGVFCCPTLPMSPGSFAPAPTLATIESTMSS